MKRKNLLFYACLFVNLTLFAQSSVITLQPSSEFGKDAVINSNRNDSNSGNNGDFLAFAWTYNGTPFIKRSLIDFDLSNIPDGAIIDSVKLSLFAYDSPADGSHSSLSGSNEAILCRINSPWEENTVTWNNQPSTTTQNQVTLAESDSAYQDYINIDVTNLVKDMLDDPDNSYGFLLKIATEEHFRKMVFASSDNENPALHPKLEIYYTTSSTNISTEKYTNNDWKIYPNPANSLMSIDLNKVNEDLINVDIINSAGQIVKHRTSTQTTLTINVADFSKGFYLIKIHNDDFVSTKKILIN